MGSDTIGDNLRRVTFIGDYLPRLCGIATFTTDLCENLAAAAPQLTCEAVVMNDRPEGYAYPQRVRFEIDQSNREQYDTGADFINLSRADVVCVQHEYGIFGGRDGRFLIPMLRQLRAPVVTTLHTVLAEPSHGQRQVMDDLVELSDRLVVMSPRAVQMLREIYDAPESKIAFIHHGIPDTPFIDPNYYKDQFKAEGRRVLLTFGLLSPGKGIEYALEAMTTVIESCPDVLYIVLGATHPHVKQHQGEQYRHMLQRQVRQRKLDEHVTFVNRFVSAAELCEYLGAADIYITPYLNPAQITSGTLAYAMGTGKAVVSTPYWYAQDMLGEDRGRLVGFRDSAALSQNLIDLLHNDIELHAMRKRAYQHGRGMVWPEAARQYLKLFEDVRRERAHSPKPLAGQSPQQDKSETLPALDARHLIALTDDTGVIQHAKYSVPHLQHGYSTDDQARALVVAVKAATLQPGAADWNLLATRYLSFLLNAFDEQTQRFRNFMNHQRQWLPDGVTDDVHARALWALAHVVAFSGNRGHCALAADLIHRAVGPVMSFTSPRAWALVILAIQTYLRKYSGATSFRRERETLANQLFEMYCHHSADDWVWPEDRLTYANAQLPHALIEVGKWTQHGGMVEMGLRSLDWLDRLQTGEQGQFVPIGSEGWYVRGQHRARFDQQPIEAQVMMEACIAAYHTTRDTRWLEAARRAFDWFLGRNDLSLPLYDHATGACYDGLHPDRLNENQGAESTVCWLLSLLLMHELREELDLDASSSTPDQADDTSTDKHKRILQPG